MAKTGIFHLDEIQKLDRRITAIEKAASALATSKTAGPVGSLGVVGGSLPVSSAEVLRWLEEQAKAHERSGREQKWPQSFSNDHRAGWLRSIANNLRRELERAGVRQPEENIGDETRRGE